MSAWSRYALAPGSVGSGGKVPLVAALSLFTKSGVLPIGKFGGSFCDPVRRATP